VIGALSKCSLASGGLDKICEKSLQEDEGKQVVANGGAAGWGKEEKRYGEKKKKKMKKKTLNNYVKLLKDLDGLAC
jgi:hypothetical protein